MFLKSESYKKGIFSSTILNFVAKGLAFGNSLLIAYLFGSNADTDLYFYILQLVNLVCGFINGIDLLVLIPQSMRLRKKEGLHAEMKYLNYFIRLYLIIGSVIGLTIIISPVFFYDTFSKFDAKMLASNHFLLTMSAFIIPLQLVTNLLVSIMASHKYFSVPILAALVNSLLCISFFLLLKNSLHISAGLVAIAIGFFLNAVFVGILLKKKLKWNFLGKTILPSRQNWKEVLTVELNLFPIAIRSYVIFFFLSGLGTGVLSVVNYATQVVFIPEMLILSQITAVAGIKITEMSAHGSNTELNDFFQKIMSALMFLFIPMTSFTILFSQELSHILYFRGNMTLENIAKIGIAISFLITLLPAKAFSDFFVTRFINAQQKLSKVIGVIVVMHIIICLMACLGVYYFKLTGYFIALIISYWVISPVIFYYVLKKIAPFIDTRQYYLKTLKILAINLMLFLLLYILKRWVGDSINTYITIILGAGVYLVALLWINKKLHIDSYSAQLISSIAKKIR